MRQIVDVKGLMEVLPFTVHQIYKAVRDPKNPLPFKKHGKKLLFDLERVWAWFDGLPGVDRSLSE